MTNEALRAIPCSHQEGKSRFSNKDASPKPPDVASWRNNVTALSQHYNLYFVAYVDAIHIYRPRFPDQHLLSANYVIKLPASRPNLKGYINRNKPQGVNHLVVRDLGDEEVLMLACDSGDAIGYFTRHIEKATHLQTALSVNPFFHENVGASAWGLDVHSSERMIAVSSNTHEIIVFAFALSNGSDAGSSSDPDFRQWNPWYTKYSNPMAFIGASLSPMWQMPEGKDCGRHSKNYVWCLNGHTSNIPNIAFLDAPPNDEGDIFLASIDIEGKSKLWNIWKGHDSPILSPHTQGWAVACLKPTTARITATETEAYGCSPNVGLGRALINNSDHPGYATFSTVPVSATENPAANDAQLSADSLSEMSEEDTENAYPESGQDSENDSDMDMAESEAEDGLAEKISLDPNASEDVESLLEMPEEQDIVFPLPCNLFTAGATDICLIEQSCPRKHCHSILEYNVVECQNALLQKIPPGLSALKHLERINMIHQIPDLGVVAIATQAGRVGLLTLTYWRSEQRHGFRMEAILPFKSQEEKKVRPDKPLLGMAIGPLQGQQSRAYSPTMTDEELEERSRPSGTKRYRLLMYYYDHSVLSYEISRPDKIGDLLVL